jgi:MFS family permease
MRARVVILLFAAVALAHALWIGVVTDDAGISLAYARTLVHGHGLRLTEWSPRVEAFSDPLWVLWLAIPYTIHLDGPAFAHITGALLAGAAVVAIGYVPSHAEEREPRLLDCVAPGILAFDTTYAFWGGAGLESGAFALALSLTLLFLARERWRWSAVFAGFLGVLRPEGLLYAIVLAPLHSPARVQMQETSHTGGGTSPRARAFELIAWLSIAALPTAAWVAFRRAWYGEWLPNSYYAKRSWDFGAFNYLLDWFTASPWHVALLVAPFAFVSGKLRRTAAAALLACCATVTFILFSGGDWMAEHRFVAHALPAAALAVGLLPLALESIRPGVLSGIAAALLVAAAAAGAYAADPERRRDPVLPLAYVAEQGRWFRREADRRGLPHPKIAHFDIGGLALESGGEIIDLAGLADKYIGRVGYAARAQVREYVFGVVRPDMLNVHGPCVYLREDPRMQRDYQLAAIGLWGENWVRRSQSSYETRPMDGKTFDRNGGPE